MYVKSAWKYACKLRLRDLFDKSIEIVCDLETGSGTLARAAATSYS